MPPRNIWASASAKGTRQKTPAARCIAASLVSRLVNSFTF